MPESKKQLEKSLEEVRAAKPHALRPGLLLHRPARHFTHPAFPRFAPQAAMNSACPRASRALTCTQSTMSNRARQAMLACGNALPDARWRAGTALCPQERAALPGGNPQGPAVGRGMDWWLGKRQAGSRRGMHAVAGGRRCQMPAWLGWHAHLPCLWALLRCTAAKASKQPRCAREFTCRMICESSQHRNSCTRPSGSRPHLVLRAAPGCSQRGTQLCERLDQVQVCVVGAGHPVTGAHARRVGCLCLFQIASLGQGGRGTLGTGLCQRWEPTLPAEQGGAMPPALWPFMLSTATEYKTSHVPHATPPPRTPQQQPLPRRLLCAGLLCHSKHADLCPAGCSPVASRVWQHPR